MESDALSDTLDTQRVHVWEEAVKTATHDLNNILGTVQLLIDLSLQSVGQNAAAVSDLEQIRICVAQASGVVKNLRHHLPEEDTP